MGGSISASSYEADSLGINSGVLAAPIYLGECNVQYAHKGWAAKVLGTYVSIPDASDLNRVYAKNTPNSMFGVYAELSYNIFENFKKPAYDNRQLVAFARYEKLDLNASIPTNGIYNGTLKQSHFLIGLNYLPMPNVVIKADVRLMSTGPFNKALYLNPPPVMRAYAENSTLLNIGIGYAF
jgi:hypothetical protein